MKVSGGDIERFAQQTVDETYTLWRETRFQHEFGSSGFAVFYSPVFYEPDVLFVGFNPGGSPADFDVDRSRRVPTQHEYLHEHYDLARKMRGMFATLGKLETLKNSVKMNSIFFRTSNSDKWRTIPTLTRHRLEGFCDQRVRQIIEVLHPRIIICEGHESFDKVRSLFCPDLPEEVLVVGAGNRRMYRRICLDNRRKLIGLIHPTGARISNVDWANVTRKLGEDI